jgi:hypothetical protein
MEYSQKNSAKENFRRLGKQQKNVFSRFPHKVWRNGFFLDLEQEVIGSNPTTKAQRL